MKQVKFVFAIHNHQPVGNFGHVYEEAYQKSYLPLVKALREYPWFEFNLHFTGELFAWLDREHPEYMGMLRDMVEAGQVEMLTGGYYEPVLALIPDADKVGQILKLSDYIEKRFGKRPTGMWLAERVWEPHLPVPITSAGVDYVVVDDFHFKMAGLRDDDLTGYYVTEEQGAALKVFPGSERLRYTLPFMEPEETIAYFRSLPDAGDHTLAAMADDGEKFGVWPGTHKWVYRDGWLKRFMAALEANADWVRPTTFGQYVKEEGPRGRFYLPTCSYMEMGEWSLPPRAMREYEGFLAELKSDPAGHLKRLFVKGGFFRNFLHKYPESNAMHKRMLQVSAKVHRALGAKGVGDALREEMLDFLYQGQCNDAFWHGVFGGLYLPHLRDAVYRGLIRAEGMAETILEGGGPADRLTIDVRDMDGDLADEVFMSNPEAALIIKPSEGGSMTEFDFRPVAMNMMDNLTRTEEAYHDKIKDEAHESDVSGGAAKTIHDMVKVKEKGLSDHLVYDRYRRASLIDHFIGSDTDLEDFRRSDYHEAGDFIGAAYTYRTSKAKDRVKVALDRSGSVSGVPVRVEKTVVLKKAAGFEADYAVTNEGAEELNATFGVEFNFSLLAGDAPDRYFDIPGHRLKGRNFASSGELNNVRSVRMVDEWLGYEMELDLGHEAVLWRFPVETVSQSEAGFERVFQSAAVVPLWRVSLQPGVPWKVKLAVNIRRK